MKHAWKLLNLLVFTLLFTSFGLTKDWPTATKKVSPEYQRIIEPETSMRYTGQTAVNSPFRYSVNQENITVEAMLIDSSKNGYGLVVGDTKPITYVDGTGIGIAYRQWQGQDAPSGYIGAAYSPDYGATWQTFANINANNPGQLAGRYPGIIGSDGYPWVFWNETGSNTGGGGDYGGRPLFSYDEFGWGASSFAQPADVLETPGDPQDLWVGVPSHVVDTDGKDRVNITFAKWTGVRDIYQFQATHDPDTDFGYMSFSSPYKLFDGADFEGDASTSYTSDASVSFNNDGVGYAALTSYFAGYTPDTSHTVLIRKSTDYGQTWNTSGMNGTSYYYLPDQQLHDLLVGGGFMSDTLIFEGTGGAANDTIPVGIFLGYANHVRVESDGTLHFIANAVYAGGTGVYIGADGVGFYHFWTDDPSDPESWQVSKVVDMGQTYVFSHGEQSNWQRIFTNTAISQDNEDIMYNVYTAILDTTAETLYYDVVVLRSTDGGVTWEDTVNVTDVPGDEFDAIDAHMAPEANDSTCYIMYQVPDYGLETVSPAEVPEDYKNRVYFAQVTFPYEDTGISDDQPELPGLFTLAQNYPNPFNPTTVIQYSLETESKVTLAVYDVAGQLVRVLEDSRQSAGNHVVKMDGSELAAGMYFYKLTAENRSQMKKMVLIK